MNQSCEAGHTWAQSGKPRTTCPHCPNGKPCTAPVKQKKPRQ